MHIRIFLLFAGICGFGCSYAQQVVATQGGTARSEHISLSWTIGESFIHTANYQGGYLTMGYQQPNLEVERIKETSAESTDWAIVFPNPVQEQLTIQLDESMVEKELIIQLFATDGQLLKSVQTKDTPQVQLAVGDLSSGNYLLKLRAKTQQQTFSILKHQ